MKASLNSPSKVIRSFIRTFRVTRPQLLKFFESTQIKPLK